MIGFAMCGSYCTHKYALNELERLIADGYEVLPILSENVSKTNTRFGRAEELKGRLFELTGYYPLDSITETEPLGPKIKLDALIICPCTGNTLAKMAQGITDTAVTMAAKAHLRCDRPLLIALATNDAMSQNLGNIGAFLNRKSVYFVPMKQDAPKSKPHSLVADFSHLEEAFDAMKKGAQIRPLFT